jgi:hypothetical protein
MSNPGPTQKDYDSLIYKLATLENEVGQDGGDGSGEQENE